MLPIGAVYQLYCKLGEPHTAKDFLRATCVRRDSEPPCYLKSKNKTQILKISSSRAFNAVPVGLNIAYLPEGTILYKLENSNDYIKFVESDEYQPIEIVQYEDPFFDSLIAFRHLGIKEILKCLQEVCPQICQDGTVVKIDYNLSFLEFYEVLLLCAYKIVESKRKQKEKEEIEQESFKLEQKSDHNSTDPEHAFGSPEKKTRRNSKDRRKSRVK